MAKFLFLECEEGRGYDLLYGSCWAWKIASEIRNLGHEVIEVKRPLPEDATDAIRRYKPDVVWFVGHGWCCLTTLEKVKLWISTPKDYCLVFGHRMRGCSERMNEDVLAGTVTNALSCLTGQYLGEYLTKERGCIAYMGYYEPFYFIRVRGQDKECACEQGDCRVPGVRKEVLRKCLVCMMDANLQFCMGLAQGMTVNEAYEHSLRKFDEWISDLESIEPATDREKFFIKLAITVLHVDKKHQVVHGKLSHRLRVVARHPMQFAIGMMGLPIMLGSLLQSLRRWKE